ncbi:hypothetical protein [Pontibacter rugosus]|uniref:Secreted protein n=1 Tax=Pontibacter rugosus TaxID=1745966 RepID=A0ABW3SV24_9BACT
MAIRFWFYTIIARSLYFATVRFYGGRLFHDFQRIRFRMSWQFCHNTNASALFVVFSWSLSSLLEKLNRPNARSLTHRHLTATNPSELGGLEEISNSTLSSLSVT